MVGTALVALAAATVGVVGTLLAPVLSQRVTARAQAEQFDRQQRTDHAVRLHERQIAEEERRRGCYVAANAAYRRHRVELMNFLWLVQKGEVTPEGRQAMEAARHAHHAAFAEAQMIASTAVMDELDAMTTALSELYGRTMRLEEGHPVPGGSFQEIHDELQELWSRGQDLRAVMRTDLGVDGGPLTRPAAHP
ncbi:hypothetical protein AB0C90_04175 [Streptomyces sp. NPDC048550]|uniref:hypothetical protein n=1 Tax=unclassified Streptomyces TaxID=2593676 RepID=UPI002256AA2C|nr:MULTISPECIES: hypothetical protein [unclassified Streptomyces]MCX5152344.1 hypothetical protein [Streptomyces sp. NBC_00320]WSN46786.1 hypothetical protein OG299_03245 [Streptomyces sp. NBC_01296]